MLLSHPFVTSFEVPGDFCHGQLGRFAAQALDFGPEASGGFVFKDHHLLAFPGNKYFAVLADAVNKYFLGQPAGFLSLGQPMLSCPG